jgi:hypothetical protein
VCARPLDIIGPRDDELNHKVRTLRKKLQEGEQVNALEVELFETAVRKHRPAIPLEDLINPTVTRYISKTFSEWPGFVEIAPTLVRSVARIDRSPEGRDNALATGFLVAPGAMMTNKHVVRELTRGKGVFAAGSVHGRVLAGEPLDSRGVLIDIRGVLGLHGTLDLALLEVGQWDAHPLRFGAEMPEKDAQVAAIGYPSDKSHAPEYALELFQDELGVQRISPGEVFWRSRAGFRHDCTTLAGSSGSPIVSLATGKVVGVHAEGMYLDYNRAVVGFRAHRFVEELLNRSQ